MKKICTFLMLIALLGNSAMAQGLKSLLLDADEDENISLTYHVSARYGWDSNVNNTFTNETESSFLEAGVGASYNYDDGGITNYSVEVSASVIYYTDQEGAFDDTFYNGRVNFKISHHFSERLRVQNKVYFSYEVEPDYVIGASTSRRNDQYFYWTDEFSLTYALTEILSAHFGYTIFGIEYENDLVAASEDRISHLLSVGVERFLSESTTVSAFYRYGMVEFDENPNNSESNYFLVGVDHNFSENTKGSLRVGAQVRDGEITGEETNPYVTFTILTRPNEKWSFSLLGRYSFEESEVGRFATRDTFRSAVRATHYISPKLTFDGGINYIHTQFNDSFSGASDIEEDIFGINAGFKYKIKENMTVDASVNFSDLSSDNATREYDRTRFRLGVTAHF